MIPDEIMEELLHTGNCHLTSELRNTVGWFIVEWVEKSRNVKTLQFMQTPVNAVPYDRNWRRMLNIEKLFKKISIGWHFNKKKLNGYFWNKIDGLKINARYDILYEMIIVGNFGPWFLWNPK